MTLAVLDIQHKLNNVRIAFGISGFHRNEDNKIFPSLIINVEIKMKAGNTFNHSTRTDWKIFEPIHIDDINVQFHKQQLFAKARE